MPKIIKNVHKKILDVAQELFATQPYDKVDTRQISKHAGIAAGTLYNYFPTKQALFFAVFETRWEESISRLKHTLQIQENHTASLETFITGLYREIQHNKGLGRTSFQLITTEHGKSDFPAQHPHPMLNIVENLFSVFLQAISQQYQRKFDEHARKKLYRLAVTLHLSALIFGKMPEENARETIRFLHDLTQAYITTHILP
jgi:AcrR family transcriptional regulator